MLVGITLIATIYTFAAEQFTHFLIPDPTIVEAYFQAAEPPSRLFWALAGLLVLSIVVGWFFSIYRQQKEESTLVFGGLKVKLYLFFMNRLYLDSITLRLFGALKRIGKMVDHSPVFFIVVAVLGLAIVFGQTAELSGVSPKTIVLLLLSALLIPLFPFHGVYVAALTRAPRELTVALCVLFPVLGVCALSWGAPEIPKGFLPAVSVLAAVGALWGSIKALLQVRVSSLLSYGGLVLYSILWWHFAQVGKITPQALLYAWTVTLVWGGLLLAWDRVRVRYGDLDLNQIGGLFQPMPRFALCTGLLVMAAVGLPPFGLFFGYLGILLSPSTGISYGLFAILAAWFTSCWYLFQMMRQLLFGPHRRDLRYEDLRPVEIAVFVFVIVLLVISGGIPQDWLSSAIIELTWKAEGIPWIQ